MEEERRKFLGSCTAATLTAAFSVESHRTFNPADVQRFELEEMTIADLQNVDRG
jgi:hypothetical protein